MIYYKMSEKLPRRIYVNEGGIFINYDIVEGVDEMEKFGIVASGYIEAPHKGRVALARLHAELQNIADRFGPVSDLVEPITPQGKRFFRKVREEGELYQEEEWVFGVRHLVQRFNPRK